MGLQVYVVVALYQHENAWVVSVWDDLAKAREDADRLNSVELRETGDHQTEYRALTDVFRVNEPGQWDDPSLTKERT